MSSTGADIFRFLGRGEFREPGAGSRNCPLGGNRGRGAPRRRNKGLRTVKHHAVSPHAPIRPSDVVLDDEETRASGQ